MSPQVQVAESLVLAPVLALVWVPVLAWGLGLALVWALAEWAEAQE